METPLFVPLPSKRTSRKGSEVSHNLTSAVLTEHGGKKATETQTASQRFGQLRDRAASVTSVTTQLDFDAREVYSKAVSYVLSEGSYVPPMSTASRARPVSWSDAFDPSLSSSSRGLAIDKFSSLFNVAAAHSDLAHVGVRAALGPEEATAALKACGSHFNRAAGIFKHLAEGPAIPANDLAHVTADLRPAAFLALQHTMLANALIASYQIASDSSVIGDGQCAAIAAGVRDLFICVSRHANSPELRESSVLRRIGRPAAVLAEVYDAESLLRAEASTPEMEMNVRLTRLRDAVSAIARANNLLQALDPSDPFTAQLSADVQKRVELVGARADEVRGENIRVYRTQELEEGVPQVNGRIIVHPIEYVEDVESADEVVRQFQKLAPRYLSPSAKLYESSSTEKAETLKSGLSEVETTLRKSIDKAESALVETRKFASVAAQDAKQSSSPATSEEAEKEALLTVRGAVEQGGLLRLKELQQEIKGLSQNAETAMSEIRAALSKEAMEDFELRREASALGIRRKESSALTTAHYAQADKISRKLGQAKAVDAGTDAKLQANHGALDALVNADVSKAVPGGAGREHAAMRAESQQMCDAAKRIVQKLQNDVGTAKSVCTEVRSLAEEVHRTCDDDDGETATAGGSFDERQVRKLIEDKYSPFVGRIKILRERADALSFELDQYVAKGVELSGKKKTAASGSTSDSMQVVWTHLQGARMFASLLSNMQAGARFWAGESDAIESLKQDVDSFVMSRNLEAKDIREDCEIKKGSTSSQQSYPQWQPQAHQSTEHDYAQLQQRNQRNQFVEQPVQSPSALMGASGVRNSSASYVSENRGAHSFSYGTRGAAVASTPAPRPADNLGAGYSSTAHEQAHGVAVSEEEYQARFGSMPPPPPPSSSFDYPSGPQYPPSSGGPPPPPGSGRGGGRIGAWGRR